MHLLLTVDWDGRKSVLPQKVIALDAPEGADKDKFYWDNELSDELSDTFGQCHNGFTVEVLVPAIFKGKVGVMEAPEKAE